MRKARPRAIDLFSGAGALSLGLQMAGFDVVIGVELDHDAAETYRANHPTTMLIEGDIKRLDGKILREVAGTTPIDLIAGCPPCQGFSTHTQKYRRSDPRNRLALDFVRIVEQVQPRLVMLENVPGLARSGNPIWHEVLRRLRRAGYQYDWKIAQMADFGVPQFRKRLVLIGGLGFKPELPQPTHTKDGGGGKKKWRTVRDAIENLEPPITLEEAKSFGGPESFDWHVTRTTSPLARERLATLKEGEGYREIPASLVPACLSRLSRGYENSYGRMSWDAPSPTITSGALTPSMGRFGHPAEPRALSLREAALLQTFPIDYEFQTRTIANAARQVGNALPVEFARIAGVCCARQIGERRVN